MASSPLREFHMLYRAVVSCWLCLWRISWSNPSVLLFSDSLRRFLWWLARPWLGRPEAGLTRRSGYRLLQSYSNYLEPRSTAWFVWHLWHPPFSFCLETGRPDSNWKLFWAWLSASLAEDLSISSPPPITPSSEYSNQWSADSMPYFAYLASIWASCFWCRSWRSRLLSTVDPRSRRRTAAWARPAPILLFVSLIRLVDVAGCCPGLFDLLAFIWFVIWVMESMAWLF